MKPLNGCLIFDIARVCTIELILQIKDVLTSDCSFVKSAADLYELVYLLLNHVYKTIF